MGFSGSLLLWFHLERRSCYHKTNSLKQREMIVETATLYADDLYMTDRNYPTRTMAIPSTDSNCYYNSPEGNWQWNHLLLCLTEDMIQREIKPTNYQKLATIDQGPSENPTAFLELLTETLGKHTNVEPDYPDRELMFKDWFIIQYTPDIRRKLQKLAPRSSPQLGELLKITSVVSYNWDQKEWKKGQREITGQRKVID